MKVENEEEKKMHEVFNQIKGEEDMNQNNEPQDNQIDNESGEEDKETDTTHRKKRRNKKKKRNSKNNTAILSELNVKAVKLPGPEYNKDSN